MKTLLSLFLILNWGITQAKTTNGKEINSSKLISMINETRLKYRNAKNKLSTKWEEKLINKVKIFVKENPVDYKFICPDKCGEILWGPQTVMSVAVQTKSKALVQVLLDDGADINYQTPIIHLSDFYGFHDKSMWGDNGEWGEKSFLDMAIFLLDHGANPNAFVEREYLVSASVYVGKMENLHFLDVQRNRKMKINIIMKMIEYSGICTDEDAALYGPLFSHPAVNLNIKNDEGFTPLHLAMTQHACSYSLVKLLVEKGANPKLKDKYGNRPVDYYHVLNEPLIKNAYEYLLEHSK